MIKAKMQIHMRLQFFTAGNIEMTVFCHWCHIVWLSWCQGNWLPTPPTPSFRVWHMKIEAASSPRIPIPIYQTMRHQFQKNVIVVLTTLRSSDHIVILWYMLLCRWWVACHATQHSNIPVSRNVLEASAEAVHKIRIVLRFLLGTLHDFPSDVDINNGENLYFLDRYLLHLLLDFSRNVRCS
jgi:hypothetical protein